LIVHSFAVRTAQAASLGARAKRLFDDGLDGTGTSAAFGAAAEATINLLRTSRQIASSDHGIADIVVAEDVTGTYNHGDGRPIGDANSWIVKAATRCKRKSHTFKLFQTDAQRVWNDSKTLVAQA
jgi:hypothetical protein